MHVGRAVGYTLLAVVDAVVPAVVVAVFTLFTLLWQDVAGVPGPTVALAAGAGTLLVTILASAVSHYRGGSPFAFTRLARWVVHYWLFWPPWAPLGRR